MEKVFSMSGCLVTTRSKGEFLMFPWMITFEIPVYDSLEKASGVEIYTQKLAPTNGVVFLENLRWWLKRVLICEGFWFEKSHPLWKNPLIPLLIRLPFDPRHETLIGPLKALINLLGHIAFTKNQENCDTPRYSTPVRQSPCPTTKGIPF